MRWFLSCLFVVLASASVQAEGLDLITYPKPLAPEAVGWADEAGNIKTLDDYKGQVVLLNVWATWCPPCIRELPQLDKLQWRYGAAGFQVVPIAQDTLQQEDGADVATAVRNFYNRYRIKNLSVYHDPAKLVTKAFPARSLPTSYLINKKGEIVATAGFGDWLGDTARAAIEHELRQESGNPVDTFANLPTTPSQKPKMMVQEQNDPRESFWNDIFNQLGLDNPADTPSDMPNQTPKLLAPPNL